MSELTDLIQQRGCWNVVIRPESFDPERVPYSELTSIIEQAAVHARGWSLPYVDVREVQFEDECISEQTDWQHHLEAWRFFTSGQFVFLKGITQDWRDRSDFWPPDEAWVSGSRFPIFDAVFRFTEIFELAARLSTTVAGDEQMHIRVRIENLAGRELYLDASSRAPMYESYRTAAPSYERSIDLAREELIAEPREGALRLMVPLFERFGWAGATPERLREFQADLDQPR